MAPSRNASPIALLRDVSRSFHLTLRVLPRAIRRPIGLAYLLARTTDTIADTELVPLDQRLRALRSLRERILGLSTATLDFSDLARGQGAIAERLLLERGEASVAMLQDMPASDQERIRTLLDTITGGQELDLRRFADASSGDVRALRTDAELEDYTYRVAGCVGEFWTKMCLAHLFRRARLDEASLLRRGVQFGQGLQLVNILRDLPADLRKGRCYLPADELAGVGLRPADLLQPAVEPRLRPAYDVWLDRAEGWLGAGWVYTNALPWRQVRVRLACAWPILIGLKTVARLRTSAVLDPDRRIKISRPEVRRILAASVVLYPLPALWQRLVAGPRTGEAAGA
jgi:farnesyl-diphosphate farnesyltransferase